MPLDVQAVRGILPRGGTILGSSRTNPLQGTSGAAATASSGSRQPGRPRHRRAVAIGGEDTLGVADKLGEQGVPVVGVPKTIDNDLARPTSRSASTRP